jgi:hypothetical protein
MPATIKCRCCLGLVLLALSTSLGCTIPSFDHPIVNPSEAIPAPELTGAYYTSECPDNYTDHEHLGPAGEGFPKGFLRIVSIGQPKDAISPLQASEYIAFAEKIGEHYVLCIPIQKGIDLEKMRYTWKGDWDESRVAAYWMVRLTKRDDACEVCYFNSDFLEKQIVAKQIAGEVRTKKIKEDGGAESEQKSIRVLATTQELRTFVTRHMDGGLFEAKGRKFLSVKTPKSEPSPSSGKN